MKIRLLYFVSQVVTQYLTRGFQTHLLNCSSSSKNALLVLVVGIQVLLHVVVASESLLTTLEGAIDCFCICMDLGVPGCVARSSKSLAATMGISMFAWVSLLLALS